MHKVKTPVNEITDKEINFFNKYASNFDLSKVDTNKAFNINSREGQFILEKLPKKLSNKRVLDIGCGVGEISVFFAGQGATVTGVDISSEMIKTTKTLAKLHKVAQRVNSEIADIQSLPFKSNSFDIVYGKAVLHHVNLNEAVKEVYRVLKPGGIAIFSDPLDYNLFIKLYESISRTLRSENERRLNLKDIQFIHTIFKKVEWIGTDILSLPLFGLYFLWLKFAKPNIPPEWFLDIQTGNVLQKPYKFLNNVDKIMPKFLQIIGWRVVIVATK